MLSSHDHTYPGRAFTAGLVHAAGPPHCGSGLDGLAMVDLPLPDGHTFRMPRTRAFEVAHGVRVGNDLFWARQARGRIAGVTAVLLLLGTFAACGGDDEPEAGATTRPAAAEPMAGSWKTWVLPSASAIVVPPPPAPGSDAAQADRAELDKQAEDRTPAVVEAIRRWSSPLPTQPWLALAFDLVAAQAKNPPLSTRNYALVQGAMYDATVAAFYWKYQFDVQPPTGTDPVIPAGADPSYPSEHAAIAGAASRVLAHLYPDESALRLDETAEEAARSRVQAGVSTPSDVAAGLDLGRAVAARWIERARSDGAGTPWDGQRPAGIGTGPEFWEPPPGSVSPPVDPMAGTWKAWVMPSNSMFRPPPPPAYGSAEFVAAAQELIDIRKNLTADQEALARFYEGDQGTKLPGGITLDVNAADVLEAASADVEAGGLSLPGAVRAVTLVAVALADAGISAWDAKYTYWNPRPVNAIRDLGLDPGWMPLLNTPRFPAYPSGSAGYAGAAQAVMTYLFPADGPRFEQRARDQAESRLLGGIHWRYDSVSLGSGNQIGALVVAWAMSDGS